MKKSNFAWLCLFAATIVSCNSNDTTSTTTTDSSSNAATMNPDTSTMHNGNTMNNNNNMNTNAAPVDAADKAFIMKAALGGLMEVEAGQIAQENAMNQRVKDFGAMMVRDHTNVNNELKSLASSKGITIPEDSLMMKNKSHLDQMRKMKGKAFDNHYVGMMVSDHKKDISEFEKESKDAKDADLRTWAGKTLPTLKMHLDSIQVLSKAKL